MFTFNTIGVEIPPGNYTITLYSRGNPIMNVEINTRKTQTIMGIWVGGVNPKKPQGHSGIMIYKGDVKSLISQANNPVLHINDDV